jgi:hypothetical protein
LRPYTADVAARAYAADGQRDACVNALDTAYTTLPKADNHAPSYTTYDEASNISIPSHPPTPHTHHNPALTHQQHGPPPAATHPVRCRGRSVFRKPSTATDNHPHNPAARPMSPRDASKRRDMAITLVPPLPPAAPHRTSHGANRSSQPAALRHYFLITTGAGVPNRCPNRSALRLKDAVYARPHAAWIPTIPPSQGCVPPGASLSKALF